MIHGYANGYTIPCAYAMLPNKGADSYQEVWSALKGLVDVEENPPMLLTDFEEAAASQAQATFNGTHSQASQNPIFFTKEAK